MLQIPTFADKEKLAAWFIANKAMLIDQKKAMIKYADAFSADVSFMVAGSGGNVVKAAVTAIPKDAPSIEVVSVINTTKLFDSHGDVHFDGLWNKAIKEAKDNYLIKEHNFSFDGVISDNVKVTVPIISWKDLGYSYSGDTQALVYTSIITKEDDQTGVMFDKYRTGKVKQHSVGMRYVKYDLALPVKQYKDEFKVWEKYYDSIVNKEAVDAAGYFWAVTEGKNNEGSAVMKGSNFATPTIAVSESKDEPLKDTRIVQPVKATVNMDEVLKFYQPSKHV